MNANQTARWRMPPLSRDKADTLLLMVACVLVLLPHVAHVANWVTLCCTGLLGWRGWLTFSGRRLPRTVFLLPVVILLMLGVFASFHTFFGRDAGITMLVLLLTCKLLEMHAKRDLFVVLFLSFFLLLTSYFYSQTIGSALLSLIAVATLLTAQLSFHYTGAVPSLWQRLKLGLQILGLAIPLTLLAFFIFPRIQGPLWSMPGDSHSGRTGLSDSMSPGNISDLAQSEDIAFRASFPDLPSKSAPPKAQLYWRAIVLSGFDGRSWSKAQYRSPSTAVTVELNTAQTIRQQIVLEPQGKNWLLALDIPVNAPKINQLDSIMSPALELSSQQAITSRLRYEVRSQIRSQRFGVDADQQSLHEALLLPVGFNPRTLAFATDLRQRYANPRDQIQQVLQKFRNEPYEYTLQPPRLGINSVDDFLFITRAGFCEHYASAFVVLMRAMGIPARVVTGYQGGEINQIDGNLEVRQSDAHAWAEVWLAGEGWVRVDPTAAVAPERVSVNLASTQKRSEMAQLMTLAMGDGSTLMRLRMRWDAINNSWNQWVLNYNQAKQLNFFHSLGLKDVDWGTLTIIFFSIAAGIMALIALAILWHRPQIPALDRVYFSLCKKLASHDLPRALHEGPLAYSLRLQIALPTTRYAPIQEFLSLYAKAKYGHPHQQNAQVLRQLKRLLASYR